MNEWLSARSILAVRLDNAGDVIMLGPALRAIKETSPEARLTLLASPSGSMAAPLLPWVDDVITARALWQDLGTLSFSPERERELIARLRGQFDAAFIFTSFSQSPHAAAYACYLAGIPLRAGDSKEFGGSTLSLAVDFLSDEMHQSERACRLVEAAGFTVRDRDLSICLPDLQNSSKQLLPTARLDPNQPFVIIHPGASAEARRYPAPKFGAAARLLTQAGVQVLVTGVEKERPLVDEVLDLAPAAHGFPRPLSMAEFASLVGAAAAVVCNNSLPLHLSEATRTPVVVMFSGTDLEPQWAPRATPLAVLRRPTPCTPCYRFSCPIGTACLDVEPQSVVKAVMGLFDSAAPRALRTTVKPQRPVAMASVGLGVPL